ncbi:MAG: hypothetical protein ACQEQL_02960 [Pseudomonadota bacterium]
MSEDHKPEKNPLTEQLRELKDKKSFLHHKIQAIELKHQSAQKWITENRRDIAETYASLHEAADSALENKDMNLFIEALIKASPLGGVALDIPRTDGTRFYDYIAENGKDLERYKDALQIMRQVPLGIPASAFTKIDEKIDQDIAAEQEAHKAETDKTTSWWKRLASIDIDETMEEIKSVKSDLLEIQYKRPYKKAVITGFFEWAHEATEQPDGKKAAQNIDYLKEQHEDPEYVANIAQQDFNETLRAFAAQNTEGAQQYVRLKTFLSKPEDHSEQDMQDLIDSTCFDEICSWTLKDWNPLDGKNTLVSALQEKMGTTPQFFGFLNQLLRVESPAYGQPNTFLHNMLDGVLKLDNDDRLPALRTAIKAIKKSGAPLGLVLEDTSALRRVAESGIETQSKKEILAALLEKANPAGFQVPVGKLTSIIEAADSNNTDLQSPDDHYFTSYEFLEPEGYALMSKIMPEFNLYVSCLDKDSAADPSFFQNLLRKGVPFEMGNQTDYTALDALKSVYRKTLDNPKWGSVLSDLYSWIDHHADNSPETSDSIKAILLQPTDGGAERFIDRILMKDDFILMGQVLSFLKTPIAKVNFLYDMAENAPTPDLKERYQEISQSLDTPLLEYREGAAFAPEKVSFVVARDYKISCQLEDNAYTLPGLYKDAEMSEIFYSLLRYGFTELGGQLVNPENISYAEVTGSGADTTLLLYPNSLNAKLQIEGEDADSALEKLTATNPELLRLADSVINLKKLDFLYFEDDVVNLVCQDTTVLTLKCEGTAKEDIKNILADTGYFANIGEHFINTNTAESFTYFEEDEQFVILNGETTYTAGEKLKRFDESYLRDEIPAITCSPDDARKLLNQLNKTGYLTEGNMAVQPESICEIATVPDNDNQNLALLLSKQNRIFDCLTATEQTSLKDKILDSKEFIKLGEVEIAVDQIRKYDCEATNPHILVGSTVYLLEDLTSKERATLEEKLSPLKNSRHLDRAQSIIFDADMLDAVQVESLENKKKTRLSLVYNGVAGTSDRQGGEKILRDLRRTQSEKATPNDYQKQTNQRFASNITWRAPVPGTGLRTEDYWGRIAEKTRKLTQKPEITLFGNEYQTKESPAPKRSTTTTSSTYTLYSNRYSYGSNNAGTGYKSVFGAYTKKQKKKKPQSRKHGGYGL